MRALLALLALCALGAAQVTLPLQRAPDGGALALTYAGQPQRLLPLRLVFSSAGAGYAGNVTTYDLHGQYAGLVLNPRDSPIAPTAQGDLLSAPRVALVARGQTFSLFANTSAAAWAAASAGAGAGARGALMLAPGSSVWLQWRYATLDASSLTLHEEPVARNDHSVQLACDYYDDQGRCVLAHTGTLSADAGVLVAAQVILDFARANSILPGAAYAALLVARGAGAGALTLRTGALTAPLATRRDVSTGHGTLGQSDPEFVVSADAAAEGGADAVVLGRRTLQRLFTTMTFDSATHVWTATVASPGAERAANVKVLVWLIVILSFLLLPRFYVSSGNVRLRPALATRLAPTLDYASALDRWQLVLVVLSAATTLAGAWLGYATTVIPGSDDTYPVHVPLVAYWSAVTATVLVGLLVVVWVLIYWPPRRLLAHLGKASSFATGAPAAKDTESDTESDSDRHQTRRLTQEAAKRHTKQIGARQIAALVDVTGGALHIVSSTLGLVAALAPLATEATVLGRLVLALVAVLFVLPAFTYHVLAQAALLVVLHQPRAWRRALLALVWAAEAVALGLVIAGTRAWVVAPAVARVNALYSATTVLAWSWTLVLLVLAPTTLLVLGELLAALRSLQHKDGKKQV